MRNWYDNFNDNWNYGWNTKKSKKFYDEWSNDWYNNKSKKTDDNWGNEWSDNFNDVWDNDWSNDFNDDWEYNDNDYEYYCNAPCYTSIGSDFLGEFGELLTESKLKNINIEGVQGLILHNICIPKYKDEITEIDILFITQKGIFVVESKNYSGWIFGDEKSLNWTTVFPNREKFKFYNPVKQNQNHIKWLKKFLNLNTNYYSLIIFSERCELKRMNVNIPNTCVIKRNMIRNIILNVWQNQPDILSKAQMDSIYKKIDSLPHLSKNDYIKNNPKCPLCGNYLMKRTAHVGKNVGNQFWGCSTFPNCRYTKNID